MMTNFSGMLRAARQGKYAVGSFNVYNYETIRGVIEAGREAGFPTIVAFGENYLPNMELAEVSALVRVMADKAGIPVVLHLDHCKSFDNVVRAIAAGFTSVMFDGSAVPLAENTAKTARL